MKILYYIIVGLLVVLFLKIIIGLTGAAFKLIIFLVIAGFIGYLIVSLINKIKK